MKWSLLSHWVAFIAGIAGVLFIIAAWVSGTGTLFGLTQQHYYEDAKTTLLVSIAFGIGTLIHQREEKK